MLIGLRTSQPWVQAFALLVGLARTKPSAASVRAALELAFGGYCGFIIAYRPVGSCTDAELSFDNGILPMTGFESSNCDLLRFPLARHADLLPRPRTLAPSHVHRFGSRTRLPAGHATTAPVSATFAPRFWRDVLAPSWPSCRWSSLLA